MTIETISPLQTGTYYVNSEDFNPELFFNDTNSIKYFIVVSYDYDISKWKVVYNGKLQGYNNNVNYSYRINLDKFINLKEYDKIELNTYENQDETFYMEIPKMNNKISVIISDVNILNIRTDYLDIQSNGEIYVIPNPDVFVDDDVLNYSFLNKKTSETIMLPSNDFLVAGTYVPFTIYGSEFIEIVAYNNENEIITINNVYINGKNDLFMLYIPYAASKIIITNISENEPDIEYNVVNLCAKPHYYWGSDGNLEVVYLEGNENLEETTEKEYITLNNKQYPKSIKTTKQMKRNTGYTLKEEQVYDLYKSSYIFSSYDGELETPGRNLLNNSTSPNWSHNTNPAYATNNIITNDGEQYNRVTPTSGNLINIYGMTFIYPSDNFYIASCWVRQKSGGNLTYNIFELPQSEPYKDFIVPNNTWTRIYTNAYEVTNSITKNIIITQQETTTGIPLEIKNCQIEYENENYLIYTNGIGYIYKLEKDGIPTVYKKSLYDSGTLFLKFKKWILDNSVYDGWKGKQLSERNIELILKDEKTYKKYLNIKTNFYD